MWEAPGDSHLREMLAVLGLESLLAASRAGAGRGARAGRAARARRVASATSRPPIACAMRSPTLGWEVRDGPGGFELSAAVILYGRNPVREALRGRRAAQRGGGVGDDGRGARAVAEGRAGEAGLSAQEIERRCGSGAHQGVCADAGAYPYASAEQLLSGADPLVVALDQVQDPQNLGSICRTAECVGAAGVVIPERRAAEVTAGGVQGLGRARSSTWRVARVRNMADFLAEARGGGCWCYGASAAGAAGAGAPVPYDAPSYCRRGGGARAGQRGQRPAPAGGEGLR